MATLNERTLSHMILTLSRELSRDADFAADTDDDTYPILHVALVRVSGEPEDFSDEGLETRLWAASGVTREPAFGDGRLVVYQGDKRDRILAQFAGSIESVETYDDDDERFITGF